MSVNAKIIDADGHVRDRDADIRAHMEDPWNKREGSLLPSDEWDSSMFGTLGMNITDVPTRLRDMDTEGIEMSVLFPTGAFHVNRMPEKAYAGAFSRAYNNWISSMCSEAPERLKGVGVAPFQDVPAAVEEINRAVTKLGVVGITVGTYGMKDHLGQELFWPIYEELERLDVPLLIHNSRSGPAGENRFDTFLFKHTIGRPFETMLDCAALMYGGVPERFPKLRIAFLECGVGWVPYWMDRMDEEYEHRQSEAPLLKAMPSEYMKAGNWYYAAEPEEESLPYGIERVGEKNIVFASDYPHWDGMFPNVTKTIKERTDISDDFKAKFLGDNAKALYGWS